ncbi:hypothetical protein AM500_17630 [Bacillus sp. FJAT-18017]|uniref:DUF1854 domain-containing protein n=1 Tax=Bacillus sp. FJAT-18017 TaxID=1705566 RepID=UPI0006AF1767|nr:DUF1854 domain-containing protein [Bacillus sp. FJAT-18017]ALC91414.1 hypothetical protein AM500_17630 [Bacillus sp. FJAT-18017]
MKDPFDITIFEPNDISFKRNPGGILCAVIDGTSYSGITLYQAFPFKKPAMFISVWHKSEQELGVIRDIEELDQESRLEVKKELRIRYIIPTVLKVKTISEETGLWLFKLETDRGDVQLIMPNIHEHIQFIGRDRLVITDMDGKRCEIPNTQLLDTHSRIELQKII